MEGSSEIRYTHKEGNKQIVGYEDSQALPARPSGKGKLKRRYVFRKRRRQSDDSRITSKRRVQRKRKLCRRSERYFTSGEKDYFVICRFPGSAARPMLRSVKYV